jgi:BMFP domain-containing protein YqiC
VVDEKKFNEMVENTTKYLQMLMDKNADLEKRVAALEAKKPAAKRGANNDA